MQNGNKTDNILQHITSLIAKDVDQILLEQLGIGYSQYKILRLLREGRPFKQKFISNSLGQTEASISRQINILITMQLITKRTDIRNKRVRLIQITNKGNKMSDAASKLIEKYYRTALSAISPKQQVDLLGLLLKIHSEVCPIDHSPDGDYISYLLNN